MRESYQRHVRFQGKTFFANWRLRLTLTGVRESPMVSLSRSNITDGVLRRVARVKGVRSLHLNGCKRVTDSGVAELAPLSDSVELINLSGTAVTDSGLSPFAGFSELTSAILNDCPQLTDEALRILSGIPTIAYVDIQRCPGISLEGIHEFKRARPQCRVVRRPNQGNAILFPLTEDLL